MRGVITDVEELVFEGEDTGIVAADHEQGVVQLGDAGELGLLHPALLLGGLVHPLLGVRHDGVHHAELFHKFEELVGELNRPPVKVLYIRPIFSQYYSTYGRVV